MKTDLGTQKYTQLIEDGFCVFEKVLDAEMVRRVEDTSNHVLDAQDPEHFEKQKSTGSLATVFEDPFFVDLITRPAALAALKSLGFDRATFYSGYIISKPPHSPPLFWHQDWFGWNDPVSYKPLPQQVFLMYYLVDTTPSNGCLRLIPGSHLKRHIMHDAVPMAHTEDLQRASDPDHPAFHHAEGEIDIAVKAGDLVIGDARILHSAYANRSDDRRTVITLWHHPLFYDLPDSMRAHLAISRVPNDWPEEARNRLLPLRAVYDGEAEPMELNRVPGPELAS